MGIAAEHNEIRKRFNTVWANRTPIAWPNVSFNSPNPQTPWVRFSVRNTDSMQVDIGSPTKTFRNGGIIFIQIFGAPNEGTADLAKLADDAAAIFRNWCGVSVRCRAASIKDIGTGVANWLGTSSGADGWYQMLVTIPFQRDEIF